MIFQIIYYTIIIALIYAFYIIYLKPKRILKNVQQKYGDKVQTYYKPLIGIWANGALKEGQTDVAEEIYFLPYKEKKTPKLTVTNWGDKQLLMLLDPELIQEACTSKLKYQSKSMEDLFLYEYLLKEGIIIKTGDEWKCQRKLLSPLFEYTALTSRIPSITNVANQLVENLGQIKDGKILERLQLATGDVVLDSFFGDSFKKIQIDGKQFSTELASIVSDLAIHSFRNYYYIIRNLILNTPELKQIPKFLLTSYEKILISRVFNMRKIVQAEIDKRAESNEVRNDFFQRCIEPLKNKELNKENVLQLFITIFFAGLDTTSHLLLLMLYFLSTLKEEQEVLRNEINSVFPDSTENITIDDLNKLTEMHKFIYETLRLRTPAPSIIPRKATEDHYIGEFFVPKGSTIDFNLLGMGYNENIFKDPKTFDRNRENVNKQHPYNFVPFSGGPRNCIGQHMGLMETKIFMIKILKKYEILRNEEVPLVFWFSFLYEPKYDNLVIFKKI